jgi:hypothetical protein
MEQRPFRADDPFRLVEKRLSQTDQPPRCAEQLPTDMDRAATDTDRFSTR